MSSSLQWTDEIDGGFSFNITKIGDLSPSKGNFHDYNHKVLFMSIFKNLPDDYKYKMGINFYRLERFSLDCRKTKTKVNTLANQRA